MPMRYCLAHSMHQTQASASHSMFEYCFSVSVNLQLIYITARPRCARIPDIDCSLVSVVSVVSLVTSKGCTTGSLAKATLSA